ncbi:MAG TPA: FecR domain-containing protein [Rhizomicrobium sp.]|nr:FecR domain-containing protein [Rhizomicrobium sp.]
MSEAFETGAMEIEARAAAWLERRNFGRWSEEDEAGLDAWLAGSPAHRVAFVRLSTAWERAGRMAALAPEIPAQSVPPFRVTGPFLFRIAAVFAVLAVMAAGAIAYLEAPRERTYSTAIGGRELVKFADGSRIELNTNTVLRARMTTSERVVWLDHGEAYFEIKHDAAHPFVVMAGAHRVTDMGTKFRMRRDKGRLQVSVVQGRVTFDTPDSGKLSPLEVLTPGDVAVATAKSVSVRRESAQDLTDQLSWRQGVLVFDHTTLAQAAAEFNRYNTDKLVIADAQLARRTIGGTFPTNNLEAFIGVTQDLLGLHVKRSAHAIVISR